MSLLDVMVVEIQLCFDCFQFIFYFYRLLFPSKLVAFSTYVSWTGKHIHINTHTPTHTQRLFGQATHLWPGLISADLKVDWFFKERTLFGVGRVRV